MGETRDLIKKIKHANETWYCTKMGTIKDESGMDLTEVEDIKKSWKNTQKNYTKKILITQITMIV